MYIIQLNHKLDATHVHVLTNMQVVTLPCFALVIMLMHAWLFVL